MKSYKPWAPTQFFLLPPSPLEWLPEGHLAYFVLDARGFRRFSFRGLVKVTGNGLIGEVAAPNLAGVWNRL